MESTNPTITKDTRIAEMNQNTKVSYKKYREFVVDILTKDKTWGKVGVYNYKGKEINCKHILPLKDKMNTRANRAAAIEHYLDFDCKQCLGVELKGLHQFAHHLNSSQLLCMMFFSKLIDNELRATEKLVTFMRDAFGIEIHEGAQCNFEYTEEDNPSYKFDVIGGELKEETGFYEGTSFDFHIQDGETEVFFEIKFTEPGFKKEKRDGRHEKKAQQYLKIAPQFVKEIVTSEDDFLNQYQIYRNVIRATGSNKYVIFISDGNNPATNKDKDMMEKLMPTNVQFKTWQEIMGAYPDDLPFQFKVLKGKN